MYCKYCGKETTNNNDVCEDCKIEKEAETINFGIDKKYGYNVARASTIIGSIAAGCSMIIYCVIISLAVSSSNVLALVGLLLVLMNIPLGIIPIVQGVQSIKKFKEALKYKVKPVRTLVLGIVGISTGAYALLFTGINLLIALIAYLSMIA